MTGECISAGQRKEEAPVYEDEWVHHSGEELAELRQRSAESEVNELELKARLKGDGRPDLNQALGAQPATACDRLEEVSNCLKRLWSPFVA